jgi:hypothetical protein
MYRQDDSYFWLNRKEVLDAAESVAKRDLFNPCALMENYEEYLVQRRKVQEESTSSFIKILDKSSSGIKTPKKSSVATNSEINHSLEHSKGMILEEQSG